MEALTVEEFKAALEHFYNVGRRDESNATGHIVRSESSFENRLSEVFGDGFRKIKSDGLYIKKIIETP